MALCFVLGDGESLGDGKDNKTTPQKPPACGTSFGEKPSTIVGLSPPAVRRAPCAFAP